MDENLNIYIHIIVDFLIFFLNIWLALIRQLRLISYSS